MLGIDRKNAAKLLNVSTRTIDRYIARGILSKQEINGRIIIAKTDLENLKKLKGGLSSLPHEPISSKEIDEQEVTEQEYEKNSNSNETKVYHAKRTENQNEIYKKLYEETQEELKIKQKRLEGANYRVGQLESLLKESIPLIEYKKVLALEQSKRDELENILNKIQIDNDLIQKNLESKAIEAQQLDKRLKEERFNKKIYLIILILLFLLQPLWIIFPLK